MAIVIGMPNKKRTSIYIDENLWNKWMHFVIDAYGSSRKASEALEDAMKIFMKEKSKPKISE